MGRTNKNPAPARRPGRGRLLGVNDVTSRRWAKSGVDGTVVILLRLLLAGKITIDDVETARL